MDTRLKATFAQRCTVVAGMLLMMTASLHAQPARPSGVEPPAPKRILDSVGIDQRLGEKLPLELTFRNEAGQSVRLGELFRGKPVVLSLVYYECPSLCTMTLNGMGKSFKALDKTIGDDFDVITVSFDPRETPDLAAAKKATYVKAYGRPAAQQGWHFLTGDEASIKELCQATGFRYVWDENSQQYAHASAIMVLTPDGVLSRYFYGLEYSTRELRLGLYEASDGKVGSLADAVLLLCFHYDPLTGKYGWAVMGLLRIAAVATIVALGTFMLVNFRRDRRATKLGLNEPVAEPRAGA